MNAAVRNALLCVLLMTLGPAAWGESAPYLVKDIYPGVSSSNPAYLTGVDSTVYFSATDGIAGVELWKSDGTADGTALVRDSYAGGDSSTPTSLTAIGWDLFASVNDGQTRGLMGNTLPTLWKFRSLPDGTTDAYKIGTVSPSEIVATESMIFFRGRHNASFSIGSSYELYGTSFSGSVYLVDEASSSVLNSNAPTCITPLGSSVLYAATESTHGNELWRSDGTLAGTVLVKDINSGTSDSSPASLKCMGAYVYMAAYEPTHGCELWRSDGSTAGTVLLNDINTGSLSSNPALLTVSGSTLFFVADDGLHGTELWKSDGTTGGTALVKDIRSGSAASSPQSLTVLGSTLYFTADDGTYGRELWKTDGTAAGTVLVKDINMGSGGSLPANLAAIEGAVYFAANDGLRGVELWVSRGSASTTLRLSDIASGLTNSNPSGMTLSGTHILFSATDGTSGTELWGITLDTAHTSTPRAVRELNRITWTWADNSPDETGFNVYADPGTSAPTTLRATTGANVESWVYEDLDVNTAYSLQVAAIKADGEESRTMSYPAWTLIEPVTGIEFEDVATNTITASITGDFSNLAEGSSGLYLENLTSGAYSGWLQAITPWTSHYLSPNTEYTFSAKSRNGDMAETTPVTALKYTLAAVPSAPVISNATAHSLDIAIGSGDGNPDYTRYALQVTPALEGGTWIQTNGTPGTVPAYQTPAEWGTTTVTGMMEYTYYTFRALAKNEEDVETTLSNTAGGTTLDRTPPGISIDGPSPELTGAGPVSFVVAYADAGSGLATISLSASDITLTGGPSGDAIVSGSGNTRTVTVSNITGDGELAITIAADTAADASGNSAEAAGPSAAALVDNTPPGITLAAPIPGATSSGPVSFAVSYTGADVVTLNNGDIQLSATGTASASLSVTGDGAAARTVVLSNITGEGSLSIAIAPGTAADAVGNLAPAAGPGANVTVDNTPPTPPVITTDGGNGAGVSFSTEAATYALAGTTDADTAAIFVNGANLSSYTAGSTSWQYPATLVFGSNTFSVLAQDAAGNNSPAAVIEITRLPHADLYLSSGGSDEYGDGSESSPWKTIAFAMNIAGPFATAERPLTMHLAAETYTEKVFFASHVRLRGAGMEDTFLQFYAAGDADAEHTVAVMAEDTAISDLTISLPATMQVSTVLLKIENVAAQVSNILFDGRYDLFSIGIEATGTGSSSGVISTSQFLRLQYGVLTVNTAINITQNIFDEIGGDAVFTRPPNDKTPAKDVQTPVLGSIAAASSTGLNVFGTVDGLFVKNANSVTVLAENNDWGLYTAAAIQAKISGDVDFVPWSGGLEGEGGSVSTLSADENLDSQIDLSELLRVIQFFNSAAYHCASGSEDGFAPGAGDETCTAHTSDYNPQDWAINLSELLRTIQFFNSGGYHACPEESTEDGFCTGLS